MSRSRANLTLLLLTCLALAAVGCETYVTEGLPVIKDDAPVPAPVTTPVAVEVPPEAISRIKLLIPERTLRKDKKLQALRVTYDDIDLLKILNMEPVVPTAADYLPGWLKDLSGKQVVIRGWMVPPFRHEGIRKFLFTRDNGTCCFGPNAKIYDKIAVSLRDGDSVRFIDQHPFDVTGVLKIDPYVNPEGQLELLYLLEEAHVIE